MILDELRINDLRNINELKINLHPRYNIFSGKNGSGKTSILEAIYLLSTGHSFRTREILSLINYDKNKLTVYANTSTKESISIQKSTNAATIVKLNKEPCKSSSELAYYLPCQVIHYDIFQIIDAGPQVRRSLLDWGVFHVEHSYLSVWKDYRRVLKQRNALLKQTNKYKYFIPWDEQLAKLSLQIHAMRLSYFEILSNYFQEFLQQLTDVVCIIGYEKGWDKKNSGKDLMNIFAEQFSSDLKRQYTQSGAHQADITFCSPLLKAKQVLSRGQQKILLIALKLAQGDLLTKPCLYLLDDIAAELDEKHINKLMVCLNNIKGQFIITAIEPSIIATPSDQSLFVPLRTGSIVSRET